MPNMTGHDLAVYRLQRAKESLQEATTLKQSDQYRGVANRSYYAVFHAMRAVLATEEVDFKKHSAIISYFRQAYIKTGIFPQRCSNIIHNLFEIRTSCDYDDFFLISKEEIFEQYEAASYFVQTVSDYLQALSK